MVKRSLQSNKDDGRFRSNGDGNGFNFVLFSSWLTDKQHQEQLDLTGRLYHLILMLPPGDGKQQWHVDDSLQSCAQPLHNTDAQPRHFPYLSVLGDRGNDRDASVVEALHSKVQTCPVLHFY